MGRFVGVCGCRARTESRLGNNPSNFSARAVADARDDWTRRVCYWLRRCSELRFWSIFRKSPTACRHGSWSITGCWPRRQRVLADGLRGLVSLFCDLYRSSLIVYRFMPNAYVTVRDAVPGALSAGLLWEASKYVFAWSLNYFHYDQVYGSVGAVVAVLTWGYVPAWSCSLARN